MDPELFATYPQTANTEEIADPLTVADSWETAATHFLEDAARSRWEHARPSYGFRSFETAASAQIMKLHLKPKSHWDSLAICFRTSN
jgi:hypothetical protein